MDAFDRDYYKLYAAAAGKQEKPLCRANPNVGLTLHPDGERCYAVLVNYSAQSRKPSLTVALTRKETG